jgi:hypothetical protein
MSYTPPQNTVAPLPPGASDMRSASIANTNSVATKQNELNQLAGSRKRNKRRFRGGATTGTITVPVVPNPVPETGSGANTTSANITNSTKVGAAENANSKYDACVGQGASCGMAGGRKRSTLKGGWPSWGCMSGGVSRRKKSSRKRRKGRKSLRRRGRKSK